MKRVLWIILMMFATQMWGQSAIPGGTVVPVSLRSSLNSGKLKAGQIVTGRVAQDVPLASGSIPAGTKVIGHVVDVKSANGGAGAQVSVKFDTLVLGHKQVPVTTDLRALASMMTVNETQIPDSGPRLDMSPTTRQIGGEVVYRGGGPVTNGSRVVGEPAPDGVLVHVSANSQTGCPGASEGDNRLQALWVFSSDACGTYGFDGLAIATSAAGQITLASDHGDVNVRSGSGMLLQTE